MLTLVLVCPVCVLHVDTLFRVCTVNGVVCVVLFFNFAVKAMH